MTDFLKNNWEVLTATYDTGYSSKTYKELIQHYSSPKRYYHNLAHIEALLKLTELHKQLLKAPDTIRFAVWFHDAIYNASKNNNEEKSAALAEEHLTEMEVEQNVISDCCKMIIATKTHELPSDMDTFDARFLLDIDLSILATPQEVYLQYTKQIRKEYSIYPDFMYNKGRKKVLKHFLDAERIFKTDLFFDLNEKKARNNLAWEHDLFSS